MFKYWRDSYGKMPRPIRRLGWWWLLPFVGIALMLFMLAMPSFTPYQPLKLLGPYQGMTMFAFQFLTMGITIYKTMGIRRAFNASGGRLCTECGHSLAGLPDEGRCPECGHEFNIARDRAVWKEAGIEMKKTP